MSLADRETPLAAPARPALYAGALPQAVAVLAGVALLLYAYRGLPARPFAADDYQWLLSVRGLGFGQVARAAFDAGAQSHFYRPLVWLLFWAQYQLFGLDPTGYHLISLALHAIDAALLALLALRVGARVWAALIAAAVILLHPAPFEAVVWISAQSELLSAGLLLAALILWRAPGRAALLGAVVALGLALLAKESAVIGLPLLALLGRPPAEDPPDPAPPPSWRAANLRAYVLPALLTIAYAALQVAVERRNYLLRAGGYGLGPQIVTNPLRSLALIVAPLPGVEHADAAWLPPLGAAVALGLLALLVRGPWCARRLVLALLLTLLPTAPFVSPPDSRYLYLPVLAAALLLACGLAALDARRAAQPRVAPPTGPIAESRDVEPEYHSRKALRRHVPPDPQPLIPAPYYRRAALLAAGALAVVLAWAAVGELAAREARFAAASGPGGSLWRATAQLCRDETPKRVIVVDPPLAAPHAEAIVRLSCRAGVRPVVVSRDQLAKALKRGSVVIGFREGGAQIEQRI